MMVKGALRIWRECVIDDGDDDADDDDGGADQI